MQYLSTSHKYLFPLSQGSPSVFHLSLLCIHHQVDPLLCDKHAGPRPRLCFNHTAFSTYLTSLLYFTHCISPFCHAFSSHLLALCLYKYTAPLCTPRKWSQPRKEHGSGQHFAHTQLHNVFRTHRNVHLTAARLLSQRRLLRWILAFRVEMSLHSLIQWGRKPLKCSCVH